MTVTDPAERRPLRLEDIRYDICRIGGEHWCRATHIPTGVTTSGEGNTDVKGRDIAFHRLFERVLSLPGWYMDRPETRAEVARVSAVVKR